LFRTIPSTSFIWTKAGLNRRTVSMTEQGIAKGEEFKCIPKRTLFQRICELHDQKSSRPISSSAKFQVRYSLLASVRAWMNMSFQRC
jgi:hypothetical protein